MAYKVSGITSENSRLIVIDKGTWTSESILSDANGNFEINGLGIGRKVVVARNALGKITGFGNIDGLPGFTYLRVGPDKEFSTISDALTASEGNGEVILIDPGTYIEGDLNFTGKVVHLRGLGNPGDVVVQQENGFKVYNIDVPGSTIYIENITGNPTTVSDISLSVYTVAESATLIFNKCTALVGAGDYSATIMNNSGTVWFEQCDLYRGNDTIRDLNGWVGLKKCYVSPTLRIQSGGPLSYSDYVTSVTEGYGTSYGNYYISAP